MAKKKNPEREPEVEETTDDTQTPETEEVPQDTQEEETEQTEESATEEPETESRQEEPEAEQESDDPERPAQEAPAEQADESAELRTQLLQAQGELAAYKAGVAPGMVEDAVTLAMAEAAKSGDITDATVTKALEAVLKRHPEWKAADGKNKSGGFKVGADRDSGGTYKKPANNATQKTKRWNRYK